MNDSIFIFFFIFFKNFKVRGRKGVRPAKRFSNRLSVRFGLQGKLDGSTIIQIVLAGTDQASRLTSACLQASVKPRLRSWARSEGTGQNLSHPFDLAYRANRTDATGSGCRARHPSDQLKVAQARLSLGGSANRTQFGRLPSTLLTNTTSSSSI